MNEVSHCLRYKESKKYVRIQFKGSQLTSTIWQQLTRNYHTPHLEVGIELDEHSIYYMGVKRIRLEEIESGIWVGELLLFSRSEDEKQRLLHLYRIEKNKAQLIESDILPAVVL